MSTVLADILSGISPGILPGQPVLIAGPTASGKSELALRIAEAQGGMIVNADASQVYDCWQVLTARPDAADLARAPHALYGHLPFDAPYSVGHWLRDLADVLASGARPIIVGGTGLYFSALTEGLSEIPPVPDAIRAEADALSLEALLSGLGADTLDLLDTANRARVQRAWEVERATGTPLHHWQGQKSPALIPPGTACRLLLDAPRDWLTPRIETRFATMLRAGGLEEARAMASRYDPKLPSCRAIGVAQAMAVLKGTLTEAQAITRASIATRQYAKRQRTWFRSKMAGWHKVAAPTLAQITL